MPKPKTNHIYTGNCLEVMRSWPDDCIDHCIADPPFGIASGRGRSSKSGLGWAFSSHVTMQEAWDQFSSEDEYFQFTLDWLREVCRVVKPNGNILVFGTYHSIYLLGFVLGHLLDRRILNSIIWFKPNAQPNITARMLAESTEQIIWSVNETPKRAKKWTFDYKAAKLINDQKQMRNFWNGTELNVWNSPVVPASERRLGKHPAQKPRAIVDRLMQIYVARGDLVLDPFAGTGVVGLSAAAHRRGYVLIERESEYVRTANARFREQQRTREMRVITKMGDAAMTMNDVEMKLLQTVPVPQADVLDKVFQVVELVDKGFSTAGDIAEQLEMSGRQGPYYAEAAVALRLIRVRKDVTADGRDRFAVTELGRTYLDAEGSERETKRRFAVLNSPIIKYVSSQLGVTQNGEMLPYASREKLADKGKVANVLRDLDLTGKTQDRRVKTIHSWLDAI